MKEDRTIFDLDDEEYNNLTDKEKYIISKNTDEMMLDIMFPNGQDEE